MPYAVATDNCRLFEAEGPADGLPVVFVHGFGSGSRVWDAAFEQIRGSDLASQIRMVRYDMRGHARSDVPPDASRYGKAHQVEDLRAVLSAAAYGGKRGPRPAVLVGHSMGGYDSLLFALCYPERVLGLCLASTGPGFRSRKSLDRWNAVAEKQAQRLEKEGLGGLRGSDKHKGHRTVQGLIHGWRRVNAQLDEDALYSASASSEEHVGGTAAAAAATGGDEINGFSTAFDFAGNGGPLALARAGLKSIAERQLPTLVVVGERDKAFRKGSAVLAAEVVKGGSEPLVIAGAGHMVVERKGSGAEEFTGALLSFLRTKVLPGSSSRL